MEQLRQAMKQMINVS